MTISRSSRAGASFKRVYILSRTYVWIAIGFAHYFFINEKILHLAALSALHAVPAETSR